MTDLLISVRVLEKYSKADIFAEQKKLHKKFYLEIFTTGHKCKAFWYSCHPYFFSGLKEILLEGFFFGNYTIVSDNIFSISYFCLTRKTQDHIHNAPSLRHDIWRDKLSYYFTQQISPLLFLKRGHWIRKKSYIQLAHYTWNILKVVRIIVNENQAVELDVLCRKAGGSLWSRQSFSECSLFFERSLF